MTITLITGANKGLGRETARRLLEIGHTVLIGARDAERGRRTADELGGVFFKIDPTSDASVAAAADQVENDYGRLDVLVNNAGTAEPRVGAADLTAREAMKGFSINVFGPIRVTHAFLPLLRASDNPRIVNVSSGVGSFTRLLTSGTAENAVTLPVYPATKAALTMLTMQYARALDSILVNAADPGFTATDFNTNRGTQTVTEGTDVIVRLATLPKGRPNRHLPGSQWDGPLVRCKAFAPDLMTPDRPFRPGLRVKGVAAHPRVFEMPWDNDGRARFTYGPERVPGQPHVIWRRPATGRLRLTSEGGEASGKPEPVTGPREHLPRANAPAVGAAWSARRLSGCRRLPAARARDRGR